MQFHSKFLVFDPIILSLMLFDVHFETHVHSQTIRKFKIKQKITKSCSRDQDVQSTKITCLPSEIGTNIYSLLYLINIFPPWVTSDTDCSFIKRPWFTRKNSWNFTFKSKYKIVSSSTLDRRITVHIA